MTAHEDSRAKADRRLAWSLVAGQFALIAAIVLLPGRADWPLPEWVQLSATVVVWCGVVVMAVAGVGLGRGLTAAPIPNAHARLRTGGLYRLVRHPIYTGLLLVTTGEVVSSRSVHVALVGALLVALLTAKARWEEARLRERFADYDDYARRTPRFVPTLRPSRTQRWREPSLPDRFAVGAPPKSERHA